MATPPQKMRAPDDKKESNQHKLHNLLMQACCEGRLDKLQKLLKQKNAATLITENGRAGYAPIHWAAYNNHKPIIDLLLSKDICKVDQLSEHCETPLHIACQQQHTELARYLLQRGASRMAVTTHRNTALHFAVSSDCAELAEMLLQDVVVKAHIDEVNAAGQTAGEIAATLGCVHTVSVLQRHTANFQLKNRRGYTAVEVAEILGNTRCHGIASGAEDPLPGPVLRHRHLLLREESTSLSSLPATHGSSTPVPDVSSDRPASAIALRRQLPSTTADPTPRFTGSTESDVPTPQKTRSGILRRKKVTLDHGLSSHSASSIPKPGNKCKTAIPVKREDSPAEDQDSRVPSLGPDSLKEVREELWDISPKWYDIGLELGLRPGELDGIRYKNQDATTSLREMLLHWLKTVDPPPTWEGLACALESRTVGEPRLAERLRTKYCKTEGAAEPENQQ